VPQHIAVLSPEGIIVATNAAWRRFGRSNGLDERTASSVGLNYLTVCDRATGRHSDEAQIVGAGIRAIAEGRTSAFDLEYPCPSDTEERWFVVRAGRFERGRQSWVVVTHENVTERKKTEQQQELLIWELNHRVKNALATVQGLMTQTLRHADSLEDFERRMTERLRALARGYELVVRKEWQPCEISELLDETLGSFGAVEKISIAADELWLKPQKVLAFNLIVNELATNALKYGALSVPRGSVEIQCRRPSDSRAMATFEWRERGGPPVMAPEKKGFGSRLIGGSATHDLNGEVQIEYHPNGLRCVIRFGPDDLPPESNT
jgi:two-component sensor histidine kinase